MTNEDVTGDPDIEMFFDDELIARFWLDGLQDSYPWYVGALREGPALPRWRAFVDAYAAAEVEIDYAPHHPHEGPYEETELAEYIARLKEVLDGAPVDESVGWPLPPFAGDEEQLRAYIAFLDHRRWRAVTRIGEHVAGIALPPVLSFTTRRFAFRP